MPTFERAKNRMPYLHFQNYVDVVEETLLPLASPTHVETDAIMAVNRRRRKVEMVMIRL